MGDITEPTFKPQFSTILLFAILYHLAEGSRYGYFEMHQLACNRVYNRQTMVVQHESAYGIGFSPIFAVTSYGITYFGKLYANLILTSSEDLYIK